MSMEWRGGNHVVPAEFATDERPEEDEDDGLCPVCGGEGFIMAYEGDGDDWGEDTYSGPMDAVIPCRHCNNGAAS